MKRKKNQLTAKTILDVMWWVELTPHHIEDATNPKFTVLKGHHDILRIPLELYKQCFLKRGNRYDTRSLRWDHEKHRASVKSQE